MAPVERERGEGRSASGVAVSTVAKVVAGHSRAGLIRGAGERYRSRSPEAVSSLLGGSPRGRGARRVLVPRLSTLVLLLAPFALLACSPEARRDRDGGPGADPGNKDLVSAPRANPTAADTTLWPGRAPTPVERLARGQVMPPAGVSPSSAPAATKGRPMTPDVPATAAQRRTFDRGTSANPRRPSSGADTGRRPRR